MLDCINNLTLIKLLSMTIVRMKVNEQRELYITGELLQVHCPSNVM